MTTVAALPIAGEALFDARDGDRTMRVSWHTDDDLCVLSLWRNGTCTASFQLARSEVPELITCLAQGLATRPTPEWSPANHRTVGRLPRRRPHR